MRTYTVIDFDGNRYPNCLLIRMHYYSPCGRMIPMAEVKEIEDRGIVYPRSRSKKGIDRSAGRPVSSVPESASGDAGKRSNSDPVQAVRGMGGGE